MEGAQHTSPTRQTTTDRAIRLVDGEPDLGPFTPVPVVDLAKHLVMASQADRPVLVAIDGHGGAGKSTLAALLGDELAGSAVVHTDDLAWHEPFFQWQHLLVEALTQLRERGSLDLRPPAWEERGREGRLVVEPGAPLVLVEGTGAASREARHLFDVVVWVQSDFLEAETLGISRDLAQNPDGDRGPVVAFWHEWMRHERQHFREDRPWEAADLVVRGVVPGSHAKLSTVPLSERTPLPQP